MLDDLEHANAAENTNPGGARNWRVTIWEIHPVTAIVIEPTPGLAAAIPEVAVAPDVLKLSMPAPGMARPEYRTCVDRRRSHHRDQCRDYGADDQ